MINIVDLYKLAWSTGCFWIFLNSWTCIIFVHNDIHGAYVTSIEFGYFFYFYFYFLNIFWRTWVLFVGPLIPLFWTSGDVSPGFESKGGSLACVLCCLHAMNSEIHLWYDTCWPLDGQHSSWSHSLHAWVWLFLVGVGRLINLDITCNGHHMEGSSIWTSQWSSKTFKIFIKYVFNQYQWHSYVMSKLISLCVSLIVSYFY